MRASSLKRISATPLACARVAVRVLRLTLRAPDIAEIGQVFRGDTMRN
jgi:hypothetical protein